MSGEDDARSINECEPIEEIRYRPNGIVHRELRDKKAQEKTATDYGDVQVDINREPIPEFGDWASISRFDRDQPIR